MSLAHLIRVPSSRPPPPTVAHLFHAVLPCRWGKDLVLIPAGCEVAQAPNPKATRVPTPQEPEEAVFRRATDAKGLVIIPSGFHLPIGRPSNGKRRILLSYPPVVISLLRLSSRETGRTLCANPPVVKTERPVGKRTLFFIPSGSKLHVCCLQSSLPGTKDPVVIIPAGCDFLSACFDHLSSSPQSSSSSQ